MVGRRSQARWSHPTIMRGRQHGVACYFVRNAMPLVRVLEPEVMDTPEEARDYDAMDHSAVNRLFVDDLLAAGVVPATADDQPVAEILDLGTGTALIPIELCRRCADCRVMAVDL